MRSWQSLAICAAVSLLPITAPRQSSQAKGTQASQQLLPKDVKIVWDLNKAYRQTTATREKICINGMWRWQPASTDSKEVPTDGWGYFRVPAPWPGGEQRWPGQQPFFPHPAWQGRSLGDLTAAWYQREITIPAGWAGRRVVLSLDYLYSYAEVFINGRRVGELRYPAGEVEIGAACQPGQRCLLSMLVVALPLKAVMLSYKDTAAAREVKGVVARRGLCGDVFLASGPRGPRIRNVRVETSVRKWQLTLDVTLESLQANTPLVLEAAVWDQSKEVLRFRSAAIEAGELANGHITLAHAWKPAKLWDLHTPSNQYTLRLFLRDARGNLVDEFEPVKFGFREFWIEGRDFYLNGSRIYLSAIPIDNAQGSPLMASYEHTRVTLQRFKSFGINFVYTHNYGCEPGAHLSFEELLRAADDEGVLVSFSMPHFSHYDWEAADAERRNGYAQHAAFYVRVAQNHPSVVFYSTSHNATGYPEDMNPYMTDGLQCVREAWSLRNSTRAMRAEALIRRLDPSRVIYHHASGNLGAMHTTNFYANWVPIQEMSDWFGHWATFGVKPLFTCEYSVPFMWDWAMYRGWYKGKREFGSAVAPWEFCLAEWNAQFLGENAYRISEEEKANIRWEAEQFRQGRAWRRWDYPHNLNSVVFDDRYKVIAAYLTDNFRAFRTWGVSATSPWDYCGYWKPACRDWYVHELPLAVDWERLQQPGPRLRYVQDEQVARLLGLKLSNIEPTEAARALYRNNMPLLAYLAGKPEAFTSKDHNFLPGETVTKQLVVINNSRRTAQAKCRWATNLPVTAGGEQTIKLPTGEQQRLPITIKLPQDITPGRYKLEARVEFDSGEVQQDSLWLDVLAPVTAPPTPGRTALFDPHKQTSQLLDALGVRYEPVTVPGDLEGFDTLIIGKAAITLDNEIPNLAAVRRGLKVIVFEQTGEVLEKRLGFRIAEYGMRWVFKRVPDHPVLKGLEQEHLSNWRGEATILPPQLTYERTALFNFAPVVRWCGIPVTRAWRAGNRGNVASALIEKPACGDFLPIVDAGYALQYSPLLEYREGRGLVLFCQMDVTGRTEPDPAAITLVANILRYVAGWKPGRQRTAVYVGEAAGRRHLVSSGIKLAERSPGELGPEDVLIVGPGATQQLGAPSVAVAQWLARGGRLLAIGLGQQAAEALLPGKVRMREAEHIGAYFESPGVESALAGVSAADVMNRDPRVVALVAGGAKAYGEGVLAEAENGRVVFCQLAPWWFDYSGGRMNAKRTFRRVSFLLNRLLANMGVTGQIMLLEHLSTPVRGDERRWLKGLYLDVPEEWDDPYRFFRW